MNKFLQFLTVYLVLVSAASAAPDGTLGTTSTGGELIQLTVPALIKISNVQDISSWTYSGGTNDMYQNRRVCIYTNNGTGNYKVTATGDSDGTGGEGSSFYLHYGTKVIPYQVKWNDQAQDGGTGMTAGVELTGQSGADTLLMDCGGARNSNFEVSVQVDDILDVPAGTYSGVLKFMVQAE